MSLFVRKDDLLESIEGCLVICPWPIEPATIAVADGNRQVAGDRRRIRLCSEEATLRVCYLPEDYGGSPTKENLAHFHAECDKIRAANEGMRPQEIVDRAVRNVSFGRGRICAGFGYFERGDEGL